MKTAIYIATMVSLAAAQTLSSSQPLSTIAVPLPTQGFSPFTSTVSACGTVPAVVVVGFPNGSFVPGTQTLFLPPQASPTSSAFIDTKLNRKSMLTEGFQVTEVVIATPLPGSCAPFSLPAGATATDEAPSASGTAASNSTVCPLKGCSAGVGDAAQNVIKFLNEVTQASQNLQAAAKQLGSKKKRGLDMGRYFIEKRFDPLTDVVKPLRDIVATITISLPSVTVLPPFPPGCDSDTIVVALIDFVQVHTTLLQILIGEGGVLSAGSRSEDVVVDLDGGNADFGVNFVGPLIAGALRSIETVVDNLAYDLIRIIPTREECLTLQHKGLDDTLREAIAAF